MPADREYLVFRKFEVADYCLTKHGEATWEGTIALTALDGIKADLLRFAHARELREDFERARAACAGKEAPILKR